MHLSWTPGAALERACQVNMKHFLHFCSQQLLLDPREELRETWKVRRRTHGCPEDFGRWD